MRSFNRQEWNSSSDSVRWLGRRSGCGPACCCVNSLDRPQLVRRRLIARRVDEGRQLAVRVAGEFVQEIVFCIENANVSQLASQADVCESGLRAGKRPAIVAQHLIAPGGASAAHDEAGGPVGTLDMLERVVVAADVKIEMLFLEDRAPLGLQDAIVAMGAVAEDRVVGMQQTRPLAHAGLESCRLIQRDVRLATIGGMAHAFPCCCRA